MKITYKSIKGEDPIALEDLSNIPASRLFWIERRRQRIPEDDLKLLPLEDRKNGKELWEFLGDMYDVDTLYDPEDDSLKMDRNPFTRELLSDEVKKAIKRRYQFSKNVARERKKCPEMVQNPQEELQILKDHFIECQKSHMNEIDNNLQRDMIEPEDHAKFISVTRSEAERILLAEPKDSWLLRPSSVRTYGFYKQGNELLPLFVAYVFSQKGSTKIVHRLIGKVRTHGWTTLDPVTHLPGYNSYYTSLDDLIDLLLKIGPERYNGS